jgi:tetratricopeptide (TPR) repeat protein
MPKKKSKKPKAKNIARPKGRTKPKKKPLPAPKPSYNEEYNAILVSAQELLDRGKNQEAAEKAETLLTPEIRKEDLTAYIFASRICAFAYANMKRYTSATEIALETLKLDNNLLDFYYLLSFSYLAMEEYSLAEVYARKFIELNAEQSQEWSSPQMMAETHTREYLVHNYLGICLREQSRFEEAEQAYKHSYELNPKYVPAYVNHARLLHGRGGDDAARKVLDLAKKKGVDAEEIKMLRQAFEAGPQVSVCMIVKNEEKMLDRCLNSVRGFANELIVVDTGSTDRTAEIAESRGAKVYHHEWEDDFSKARNYSLGYATKEWIFVLDADEEMVPEDFALLQEVMAQKKYDLVSVNVYNLGPEGTTISSFLPSIRMFRRSTGAHYIGTVHNQLKFDENKHKAVRVNARVKHYGYGLDPESMKRKIERSRALLLKQIEEYPQNYFAHFNLAQLYRGETQRPDNEKCENIIEHASIVVDNTDPQKRGQRHLHLMSLHQLVTAYYYLQDYDKAIEHCEKALEYKPDFLDPIITLGHIYSQKQDLSEARKWFLKYLEEVDKYDESQETDQIILLNLRSKQIAYYGLGLIAERENNSSEAIDFYNKCLVEDPNYLDVYFRVGRIQYNLGHLEESVKHLEMETRLRPANWAAHYILGEIHTRLNNEIRAEECFLTALSHKDDEANILYALARLYMNTNRPEEALKYLENLENVDREFLEAYRLRGDILFQFGQYREACAAYTNFAVRSGGTVEVWNNLGNSHFKLEEYEQAQKCYEKVIELDKSFSLAYRNLVLCLTRMDQFEKAYGILQDYLKLAGDDYDLLLMAAQIANHLQKFDEAINYIEKALGLNPGSVELLTLLGDCYYAAGFFESAKMGFEQALKINPKFRPARERLDQVEELLADKKR